MNIIGKVISIGEVKSGVSANTGNKWSRCQFVVEVLNTNQKLTLQTYRESIINELRTGMVREFDFDFNAREYQGKWYDQHDLTSMRAIDLGQTEPAKTPSSDSGQPNGAPQEPATATTPQTAQTIEKKEEKEGELPF